MAQCPENIDFEKGNFSRWDCDTGSLFNFGGNRVLIMNSSPPTINRHVMQSLADGNDKDYYGGFPVNCPNGSGHSIRLGNSLAGGGAERVSYTFTIPAGQEKFSLVYNYAIVLEDPDHLPKEQPRLSIEVMNVTDNILDTCSSFDFVANGSLPGFFISPKSDPGVPIRCKNWSAASINLDNKAGKTFKVSFITTDCLLGEHFGYAYIDVNSSCSNTIEGTVYCASDPSLTLKGPPGFQSYRWFNNANITLGSAQTITFTPPPQGGDTVYVEFVPYNGYGCVDTVTAYLWDTLRVTASAGLDREFCVNDTIKIGQLPVAGIVYSWSPAAGLSDTRSANPVAVPVSSALYTLTATSPGGGCIATDAVSLVKKCNPIDIYVPNAFSPDGDGKNDVLRPSLYGFRNIRYFRVYNRYGQLLYHGGNGLTGWDGKIRGKPAATQTVVWMMEAEDAYGRIHKGQGTSILIR